MEVILNETGLMLAAAPGIGGGTPTTTTGAPGGTQGTGGAGQPSSPFGGGGFLFIMFGMIIFMIVMSTMSSRKEKKRREAMLGSLGRHDQIVTTGGMIGTIVEVKADEVVVKVDESTNTRIRFNRGAVQTVLKQAKSGGGDEAVGEVEDKDIKETLEPAEQLG